MIRAGATLYRLKWTAERTVPVAAEVLVTDAPIAHGRGMRFGVYDADRSWAHYAYTLGPDDAARPNAVAVTPPGSYLYPSAHLALATALAERTDALERAMRDAATIRRQVEALRLATAATLPTERQPA